MNKLSEMQKVRLGYFACMVATNVTNWAQGLLYNSATSQDFMYQHDVERFCKSVEKQLNEIRREAGLL